MHQQKAKPDTTSPLWLAHDMIIGLLTGTGVGTIAGLFIAARLSESNLFTLGGAIVGAIIWILILVRSHQRHDRFLTTAVVVSWILLVLSVAFIALLISAIAAFN
jgi:VIT1/CCC1 family predicted Fe2+/Mn2+ transporter